MSTYNGKDVTRVTPGARSDVFCNGFPKLFLGRLRLPLTVFVIVKNKFISFFHGMYSYLPQK